MAGRPLTRARRLAAEQAAVNAPNEARKCEPTPKRTTPIVYSEDLDQEVLLLADNGLSYVEMAAHFAVAEEDMKAWEEAHPTFAAAIINARTREKAWWMAKPRIAMRDDNNRFPAGLWSHVARAKWPEFDKPDITVNIDMSKRLVLVDMRTDQPAGLLDEQVIEGEQGLIRNDVVRLDSSQTAGNEASDPPTIPYGGSGGVGAKTTARSPDMPPTPDFSPPPPFSESQED